MKHTLYIYIAAISVALSAGLMTSCSEELEDSIFDTTVKSLDKNLYTFPLDTFLIKNYQEPYNLEYIYRMRDVSSDMNYNLVPTTYENSVDFAVLCKYLWLDAYTDLTGSQAFLRQYCPRIIHLIGSPGYNPSTGTEKLGEAEGGKKITLMKGNSLDFNSIDQLNEYYFKTMHHEFGHILHQNKLYPSDFKLISKGMYSALSWQDTPDSIALSHGFISQYSANGDSDDWVELLANYLVKSPQQWNAMLVTAGYDWDQVESVAADSFDLPLQNGVSRNIMGYLDHTKIDSITYNSDGTVEQYKVVRRAIARDDMGRIILNDEQGTLVFIGNGLTAEQDSIYKESRTPSENRKHVTGEDGKGWTFRLCSDSTAIEVTDDMIRYLTDKDAIDGPALINKKLEMVREWLQTSFEINLEDLRTLIHTREFLTDEDGNFILDEKNRYINRLTADANTYPAIKKEVTEMAQKLSELFGREIEPKNTIIEQLRESVYQYRQ